MTQTEKIVKLMESLAVGKQMKSATPDMIHGIEFAENMIRVWLEEEVILANLSSEVII